jgi:putative tricarboxylic transport membrane protein
MEAWKTGKEQMKQNDIQGAVVFFLFGAITTILSLRMPIGSLRAAGSGLFPLGLGILLMVLSCAVIVKAFRSAEEEKKEDIGAEEEPLSPLQVFAYLAIIVVTTILWSTLGYAIVSFLLMLGLLRTLGLRRWTLNLTISLLTAAGSYALFVYALKIPLPKGFLGI